MSFIEPVMGVTLSGHQGQVDTADRHRPLDEGTSVSLEKIVVEPEPITAGAVPTETVTEVEETMPARSPTALFGFIVKHYRIVFGVLLFLECLVFPLSYLFKLVADRDLFPIDFKGVPVQLKIDKTYLRERAYYDRKTGYDFVNEDERTYSSVPRTTPIDILYVIYQGSNVLTRACLQAIRDVENMILDTEAWRQHGLLDVHGHVRKPQSLLRYFDGTYGSALNDTDFSNISGTLYLVSNHPNLSQEVQYLIAKDAQLSPTEVKSTLTMSVFAVGNSSKDFDLGDFWKDNYGQMMHDLWSSPRAGMNIYVYNYHLFFRDIIAQVEKDMLLAVGSFLFIVFFVLIQTQSVFITAFGIGSILISFMWTNYIYRVLLDYRYFGIFHAMSIFIILGIGTDDLFVFYDTWRATACIDLDTVEKRFTYCYRQATLSMLITSVTTAMAFLSNAFTPLYGISSFAVFTTILVMINFLSAIFFFPACVIIYHKMIEPRHLLAACVTPREAPETKEPNFVVRFFRGPFYQLVTHRILKWAILTCTTTLALTFAYLAIYLKTSEKGIQYYRRGYNYHEADEFYNYGFKKSMEDQDIKIIIAFGLKEQNMSVCEAYDYKCLGVPAYDKGLDLNPIPTQKIILTLCQQLKYMADEKHLYLARDPATGQVKVKCFLDNMNQFFTAHGMEKSIFSNPANLSLPVSGIKYLQVIQARQELYHPSIVSGNFYRFFETAMSYWLTNAYRANRTTGTNFRDDATLAKTIGHVYSSEDLNTVLTSPYQVYGTKLVYFTIEISTSLVFGHIDIVKGLAAYEAWENFTRLLMAAMPASAQGFQLASHGAWHKFKMVEAIEDGAIRGIILGSILSFLVLLLVTCNIIISLLATLNILCVIATFSGCIYLFGYSISMVESVNLSLVAGLSVDYVVHFSESYHHSPQKTRQKRVRDMLERMGVSVLSGAITTLGAALFMLPAQIFFFFQFGVFMLLTIFFSIFYCMFWFTPMMAVLGPEGNIGSLVVVGRWIWALRKPMQAELSAARDQRENIAFSPDPTHGPS